MDFLKRIENIARETPDRLILSDGEGEYDYRQLWTVSGRVYAYLINEKIGREDVVLIHLPRSAQAVMAMFGVFRAGAAMVMLEDWGHNAWVDFVMEDVRPNLVIDGDVMGRIMQMSPADGYREHDPHDLAYIAYTTGTTGQNKGVMHEYGTIGQMLHCLIATNGTYDYQSDRTAITSTLHTSIPTLATYPAIGCYVDIVPHIIFDDPDQFHRHIVERGITYTYLSPVYLHKHGMLSAPSLRYLSVSFEPANAVYSDKVVIFNEYGMRESGGAICSFLIDKPYDITPIGKPFPGYSIHILDHDGQPVQDGGLGEICVENTYCRGYLNLPEATAEHFSNGLYHTHDLGKRLPDGNYIMYGRMNDAVRTTEGLIIALEIEVAARRAMGRNSAYVKIFPSEPKPVICLYTDFPIDFPSVQAALSGVLPPHKVPTDHVQVDHFEYNNGKAIRVHLHNPRESREETPATPLVTIICMAHNHSAYIRDAMDGFLMQRTAFAVEILMHDDCSTDGTADIIRSYETRHPDRIRGIYQDHNRYRESISEWYRFLFSQARGRYIAVSDGDDYWTDPLKLQKEVDILEADRSLMACCTGCAVVAADRSPVKEEMEVLPGNRKGRYTLREFIMEGHNWPVTTVVYRNSNMEAVMERTIRMENPLMGDWTMWVALLCEGDSYFLPDVTAAYRLNPTSQTHTDVRRRRMEMARLNFRLTPIVASLLPEGYEDVRHYLLNDTAWMWWKLANAHKHEHHYLRMTLCLIRWLWKKRIH